VIEAGAQLPRATVWQEPGGAAVSLDELANDGPLLLLFYLYDWSPT
jgi:hypothetical protein